MEHRDEFGPWLKDVAVLTSLLLFGEAHACEVALVGEDQKLNNSLSSSKNPATKATYL